MNDSKDQSPVDVKRDFSNLLHSLGKFFSNLVNLQEGIDKEGTVVWIKSNKRMQGANAWLLMCSIMIASLGLDLDSPAIIIGAMLISPLMSPILGVGFGIATNDRDTLKISIQHFGVAIAIALITSFIYFWLNPLGQFVATNEIIERTEPTLLAGLVAIFGGLAGIISASRKDQSNAIPGVAIATALMPPLCVAGYGIAKNEWPIFYNAFYLFFLNSFFIAVSTFVMIRYMKFPLRTYQDSAESRRTSIYIIIVSIILTLPSIYILNNVYKKKKQEQLVEHFINEHFGDDKNPQSLGYHYTTSDSSRILAIKLLGKQIEPEQVSRYEKILNDLGVENTRIFPLQDESLDLDEFDKLKKEMKGYEKIVTQLELSKNEKSQAELTISSLKERLDSFARDTLPIVTVNQDITTLLEEVANVSYGKIYEVIKGKAVQHKVIYIQWKENIPVRKQHDISEKLFSYFDKKLKNTTYRIEYLE